MKTLSLLAAAAAALSLGLSANGGAAATYKPNVLSAQPNKPAAIALLACKIVVPAPAGAQLDIATARITNTAGVMLKKGMRIHLSYQLKNGLLMKTSFVLPKDLPLGASIDHYAGGLKCTAQVNLLAKLEPVPTVPVPR
jgi:hypothetical protein